MLTMLDRKFKCLQMTSSFEVLLAMQTLFCKFGILSNKKCGYSTDQHSLEGTVVFFTLPQIHSLSQHVPLLQLLLPGFAAFLGPLDLVLAARAALLDYQFPGSLALKRLDQRHWKLQCRDTRAVAVAMLNVTQANLSSWPYKPLMHFCNLRLLGCMCSNCICQHLAYFIM